MAILPELVLKSVSRPGVMLKPLEPVSLRNVHAVTTRDLTRVPAVSAAIDALAAASGSMFTSAGTRARTGTDAAAMDATRTW